MDKEAVEKLQLLVNRYQAEVDAGKVKKYTEEEVKKGFLLPLFDILGWNTVERSEVSAEEHIKSSGRVDYGFYLNGWPKFYLEAKSPKANIHDEQWARQAVRYAWNKGVTWAVLTNFDRLLVFNAQDIKSSLANKSLFDISYTEYISEFERLWLLSKKSFTANTLDTYAEKIGKKFQRMPISSLLYKDLDECRNLLTDALSTWNAKVESDLLDEGVQKLLDRLIFIRVAEDRGVEPPTLLPLVRAWDSSKDKNKVPLYASMVSAFRKFDATYNSNLFSEHPFEEWEEYSGATQKAITILYGKQGYYEYDFKAMPADVLGAVYENYLGHRLSKSKKGTTLDKDAGKRKEQGIYYTPNFIVDYIVQHALQPVLERCTNAEQLLKIKVLDPACGSGSFLIKALEVLNNKYKEFGYPGDEMTKLQILTSNLYGVDLDEQAVEITRLNLLINSLDGKMKLPLLSSNIKCGNSLVSGTDAELKKYFGANFRDKKPFNWEEEFPTVFAQGGFDVVIGNPPYINSNQLGDIAGEEVKSFWRDKFQSAKRTYDIYVLFIELSLSLCKKDGCVALITPNKYLSSPYGEALRKLIAEKYTLISVLDLYGVKVFENPSVYPIITVIKAKKPLERYRFSIEKAHSENLNGRIYNIDSDALRMMPEYVWGPILSENIRFIEKIFKKSLPLEQVAEVQATSTAAEADEYTTYINNEKIGVKVINTGTIDRYSTTYGKVSFKNKGKQLDEPYLDISKISKKRSHLYTAPKIVIAKIALRIEAFLDSGEYASINTNCVHSPKKGFTLEYLAAILNSKLFSFVYSEVFSGLKMGGGYFQFQAPQLRILPVTKVSVDAQKPLISLVNKIMALNSKLNDGSEHSNKWEQLKSEIEKTDEKIDQEVYKLYGLTDEEVKVVGS